MERPPLARDDRGEVEPVVLCLHAGRRFDPAHRLGGGSREAALQVAPHRLITPPERVLLDEARMELLRLAVLGPIGASPVEPPPKWRSHSRW
jgi:hypothetical protein